VRVARTLRVCSSRFRYIAASAGDRLWRSSTKSPRLDSSSSPIGVSSDTGSFTIFKTLRILSAGISICSRSRRGSARGRAVGPGKRDVRSTLLIVSIHVHRNVRIVRAWSAIARDTDCRIHHVAYVENL